MDEVILENIWPGWHIEEKIGTGSYGTVYKARHSQQGVAGDLCCAVKIIRIPKDDAQTLELLGEDAGAEQVENYYDSLRRKLVREIEMMEALKGSPNIVSIEDYAVCKNTSGIGWTIYIRMELLQNLNDYRREHRMSVDDVAHLGTDLCSALDYCSRQGIIHRDIKPANIFANAYGDFKLGDFGIASTLEELVAHDSRKGTQAYMAPEIYWGENYDATVDLYSLGIVLFRMLNHGRLPFMPDYPAPVTEEDRQNAWNRRLRGDEIPDPALGGSEFARIIRRACSPDASSRYQSPKEMRDDLLSFRYTLATGATAGVAAGAAGMAVGAVGAKAGAGTVSEDTIVADVSMGGRTAGEEDATAAERATGQTPQGESSTDFVKQENAETAEQEKAETQESSKGKSQTGGSSEEEKEKGSKLPVILGVILGAIVVFVVLFFFVPFGYETAFGKVIYAVSDAETRFDIAMQKGDTAYDNENYEKALYFYEEKALVEKPASMDAQIAVLKTHVAEASVASNEAWSQLLSDLSEIGALSSDPDTYQQQEIIDAVNVYMDLIGQQLVVEIADGSVTDVEGEVASFFAQYDTCTQAVEEKADCSSDNAQWYVNFYDVLASIDGCEEYALQLLAEGAEKYPDNEDIATRQGDQDLSALASSYDAINEALGEGDFDTAYEVAQGMQEELDTDTYQELMEDIAYVEERTEFLQNLQTLLEAGDYDGLAEEIAEDATNGISKCFLVDGVYTTTLSEGTALLYDSNGVYYGEIEDDERKGSGFQFKYYADETYQLLEGTFDGNANGTCTFTWFTSGGIEVEVTGNFTDGYEDGTMTISWTQDGIDWTGTYTADMGTYTELDQDESGASIYVIAYDEDGYSAWWTTSQLTGNGCFIN